MKCIKLVSSPSLSHKNTAVWGSLPSCIKLEIDVWIVVMPRFLYVIMEMLQLFSLSPINAKPILPRFSSAWIALAPCVLFWKTLEAAL